MGSKCSITPYWGCVWGLKNGSFLKVEYLQVAQNLWRKLSEVREKFTNFCAKPEKNPSSGASIRWFELSKITLCTKNGLNLHPVLRPVPGKVVLCFFGTEDELFRLLSVTYFVLWERNNEMEERVNMAETAVRGGVRRRQIQSPKRRNLATLERFLCGGCLMSELSSHKWN